MEILIKKKQKGQHPHIPELKDQFKTGRISRREFLRDSTLLGLSATAALSFAGVFSPGTASAATPRRGGTWKCANLIPRMDHPARIGITSGGNILRQFMDYLTETGPDNITRPMLCEKWVASADVKTWDLHLRKGVKFNTGDLFTADDVMFCFGEWLNRDVGSSLYGLLNYIGGMQNVEKVNDHQIRLHLKRPNIAVPEHLNHYPAAIMHRDFEGDITKKPVGTGPFTLTEFSEGRRAVLERRDDYWKIGADGKSLPYLDKVMYLEMGKDAAVAALHSGQVDNAGPARPSEVIAAKKNKNLSVFKVKTGHCYVFRMRADVPPWNDNRVRTALKKCQDRDKIIQLSAGGWGTPGFDAHVAPAHPEYFPKPIPEYDPKGARALLEEYAKEKGLSLPLKVKLTTKNSRAEPTMAQALRQLALPAGFDIELELVEANAYWKRWTEVPLGITSWAHRPLGVMVLAMAYTKETIGAWNETHWHDDEFAALLKKAESILDIEKRRAVFSKLEDIMQERGPVGIPFWLTGHAVNSAKFEGYYAHPSATHTHVREMWKKG